ncbi:MAG: hypothetical protein IT456_22800 [Planctomycetes bacterium]|nr:hypothetical protein [Planctomycetota bacterium]
MAQVAADLSQKLQIPKESVRMSELSDGLRRACELVLTQARDAIQSLERQSTEHKHAIEQMQELIDSLIEKPR